ncbi:MAG: hypothetical protein LBV43_05945, partial [Prevotella sp.]|nr:hypothetical protein [Prevotella sp.]
DIIPTSCIFFYLAKITLAANSYKTQPLLTCILPITLVTFKLSAGILCLISLSILIDLIKSKKRSEVLFIIIASFLILSLRCTRNVIISGYIIYPLYQIDLFSFDWKVPMTTAFIQSEYIKLWGEYIFDVEYLNRLSENGNPLNKIDTLRVVCSLVFVVFILVSSVFFLCSYTKGKRLDKSLYYTYLVCLIGITFGLATSLDPRFINGYILGGSYLTIGCILSYFFPKLYTRLPILQTASFLLIMCFIIFTYWKTRNYLINSAFEFNRENLNSILFKPWHPISDVDIIEHQMDYYSIYLTESDGICGYDMIPLTSKGGIPYGAFGGGKVQNILTIECRSNTLQSGFRTKEKYIDIINRDHKQYIEEYYPIHLKRYPSGFFEK